MDLKQKRISYELFILAWNLILYNLIFTNLTKIEKEDKQRNASMYPCFPIFPMLVKTRDVGKS